MKPFALNWPDGLAVLSEPDTQGFSHGMLNAPDPRGKEWFGRIFYHPGTADFILSQRWDDAFDRHFNQPKEMK